MSIPNRTVSIKGVFAADASTSIPDTPVSGVAYRNTAMTGTVIREGWAYKTIVDSANFNQALYEYSSVTEQLEKYGFLPWSNLTDYVEGSLCLGSNGTIYQAKQSTGPSSTAIDPTTDSGNTYWEDFVGKNYVTKAGTNTISANNTFSGPNTFSSTVELGGSATATTPSSATDNSKKVATTAWVNNHINNATIKSYLAGLGMPKATGDALTWGASGTSYTATKNGWFAAYATGVSGTNVFVELQNTGTPVGIIGGQHCWYSGGWGAARIFTPAKAGDIVKLNYSGSFTSKFLYFIPSVGE